MASTIRDEISSCVLISKEFHDWLSPRLKKSKLPNSLTFRGVIYPLEIREDYYRLYRKFTKDKTCLKKMTKCHFDENSLIGAIHSIAKLKGFINDNLNVQSGDIVKDLRQLYDKIYNGIQDDNIYNKQPD